MGFEFKKLDIPEVVAVTPAVLSDERGSFNEVFKASAFVEAGLSKQFVQFNHSVSQQNVVRGLHYQLQPHAQGKLVLASRGEIFDVAVDIRQQSPTYGQWVSATLRSEQQNMLYIPPGFAHGFCVLSDVAEMLYYCTAEYAPEAERGIAWNDSAIGITWPVAEPIVSEKDAAYPVLAAAENTF